MPQKPSLPFSYFGIIVLHHTSKQNSTCLFIILGIVPEKRWAIGLTWIVTLTMISDCCDLSVMKIRRYCKYRKFLQRYFMKKLSLLNSFWIRFSYILPAISMVNDFHVNRPSFQDKRPKQPNCKSAGFND